MPVKSRTSRTRSPAIRTSKGPTVHRRTIERYCDSVLSGSISAGRLELAAVVRFRDDCDNGGSRGIHLDNAELNRSIDFIELLKHSTGEFDGQPFHLQPWQKFVVANLFGWKFLDTNLRRFRDAMISMGRGNGKSPFMAAIVNRMAILDNEPRYQFQLAAVERAQADIVFKEICSQQKSQPAFNGRFDYYEAKHGKKSIVDLLLDGVIEPLGGEGRDGYNLLGFVADEIHAWTAEHQELWEKLQTSMSKRRQPLGLVITTAGDDRSELWLRQHKFSSQVAEQIICDDNHFSFICEIDDSDRKASLYDETIWRKGNPNLDVSVKRDGLRSFANKAKHDPVVFNQFLRYHMNVRVRSVLKVINSDLWKGGSGTLPQLGGTHCHGGLDLGWRNDLASFYLCFPLAERKFALKGWNWLPRLGGRDLTAMPWTQWIADGHIRATEGDATDPDEIIERIRQTRKQFQLASVALDPNNARAVGLTLLNHHQIEVFDFGQSCMSYNEPVREFLTALGEGRILHGGDPVLAWAADNLVLRTNSAGLVMPAKQEADEKIDPIVAALMSFARCLYGDPVSVGPRCRSL